MLSLDILNQKIGNMQSVNNDNNTLYHVSHIRIDCAAILHLLDQTIFLHIFFVEI